jgi:hypothetical protein
MSIQLHDDDVVAHLRAGAPGYPESGPDAHRTLAGARRAMRRRWGRRALGSGALAMAAVVGLTAAGPIELPGYGTFVMPGGYDLHSLLNQGEPPVPPRRQLLHDAAELESHVLPVVEELGLTRYLDETGSGLDCRVFTWSHGAFRDRNSDCSNATDPEPPFDAASEAAFARVSDAIEPSGVNVYRIEKGGWGPGTSFHLRDSSWMWNWYYSYIPSTPADPPAETRTEGRLGTTLRVHITGDWWFTAEPDD